MLLNVYIHTAAAHKGGGSLWREMTGIARDSQLAGYQWTMKKRILVKLSKDGFVINQNLNPGDQGSGKLAGPYLSVVSFPV